MNKIVCILIIMPLAMLQSAYGEKLSVFAEYNSLNDAGAGIQLFFRDFALEGIYYPAIEADNSLANSLGEGSVDFNGYSINGIYFFNMAKTDNGPYTGVPYAGIGYLTYSGEAQATYYPTSTEGTVEFTWDYFNLFGGYRWGSRFLFIDGRLGVLIGLKFEASEINVGSSFTYPKQESKPDNEIYISVSTGIRF